MRTIRVGGGWSSCGCEAAVYLLTFCLWGVNRIGLARTLNIGTYNMIAMFGISLHIIHHLDSCIVTQLNSNQMRIIATFTDFLPLGISNRKKTFYKDFLPLGISNRKKTFGGLS